jgi:hypothetical protein
MRAGITCCATGLARAFALLVAGLGVLGGCGGGARTADLTPSEGARPVQLGRTAPLSGEQSSVLGRIDEAEARRAIANYRINKKRAEGPYQLVGADLNGDGIAEAMVLFAGKDWCANTGCSLAVFQSGQYGYRVISRTVRVKAPVVVSTGQTNGWRDLLVSTGGAGGAPLRRVRLHFSGNGYTRNAMLQEEIPPDVPQLGEVAIKAPPADAAQASGHSSASNP